MGGNVGVAARDRVERVSLGTSDARPPAARFPCFDGLRALAALAVFAFHGAETLARQEPGAMPGGLQSWLNSLGQFGVAVFFVISGFLLYRPFALAMLEDRPGPALLPFWKRRFLRIFPAYWLALAVAVYVLGQYTFGSVNEALTFFGLLQNYRSGYAFSVVTVAWTLVIEVSFYVFLPIFAWVLRQATARCTGHRSRLRVQLLALGALVAIGLTVRYWSYYSDFAAPARGAWFPVVLVNTWLPAYFDWFAFGMLLALGSAWLSIGRGVPKIVAFLGRWPWVAWLIAFECYWLAAQLHLGSFTSKIPHSPAQLFLQSAFAGLAAAFFVLPAGIGDQARQGIRRVLQTSVLVMLGVVSYGIYLWHWVIWIQVNKWLPTDVPTPVQAALVFATTVAIAVVSWEVVERPIIRWSTRNAPASLFTGHTFRAASLEITAQKSSHRDREWKKVQLITAGLVVSIAVLALVIGALDLRSPSIIANEDTFSWRGEHADVWDGFDRANAPALGTAGTGPRWEPLAGSWAIVNHRATSGPGALAVVRVPATDIRATGGGIAFRCTDRQNCFTVEPAPAFATWNVTKVVDGKVTSLGNVGTATWPVPDSVLAVHLDGDRITISIDGVVRRRIDDPDLRGAVGVGLSQLAGPQPGSWRSFEAER
jgi:peptidoglycan/LPS O-acetylase OafA/YrhL